MASLHGADQHLEVRSRQHVSEGIRASEHLVQTAILGILLDNDSDFDGGAILLSVGCLQGSSEVSKKTP